jgi:peptidoglycan hydrolase-like protein with peptidoglycan-binding domain
LNTRAWYRFLAGHRGEQGRYKGDIDGDLSEKTVKALRSYQRRHGLEETGWLAPETSELIQNQKLQKFLANRDGMCKTSAPPPQPHPHARARACSCCLPMAVAARHAFTYDSAQLVCVWISSRVFCAVPIVTGEVDGIIGPNTQSAIKRYQRENGLKPDGTAGNKTHQWIKSERVQRFLGIRGFYHGSIE